MPRHLLLAIVLIASLALAACKTWYKAGGDGDALSSDQARCADETQALSGQTFEACMERAGWHHINTSAEASGLGSRRRAAAQAAASSSALQHDQRASEVTGKTEASDAETDRATELRKSAEQPGSIGGWIQIGGDAGELADAKAQCDEAGADSQAFRECMQDKGWRPVRFRITVEEPDD
jgi:predicted small secreted protein